MNCTFYNIIVRNEASAANSICVSNRFKQNFCDIFIRLIQISFKRNLAPASSWFLYLTILNRDLNVSSNRLQKVDGKWNANDTSRNCKSCKCDRKKCSNSFRILHGLWFSREHFQLVFAAEIALQFVF